MRFSSSPAEMMQATPSSVAKEVVATIGETVFWRRRPSAIGPGLPTSAVAQVGSYLGYTGRGANLVLTAAYADHSDVPFALVGRLGLSYCEP